MRVGILTQPLGNNYGGNIQNWTLQQVLKGMGHEPVTVNVRYRFVWGIRNRLYCIKNCVWSAVRRYIKGQKKWCYVNNPFAMDYVDSLPLTLDRGFRRKVKKTALVRHIDDADAMRRLTRRMEAFVVGSDQVWRQEYSPRIETFFLDFLEAGDRRPRVAYAASFGCAEPIAADKLGLCRELLEQFDAVSVREESGIELLAEMFGRGDGRRVLDPTLLLRADDYLTLVKLGERRGACVGTYILDESDDKAEVVRRVADRVGCPLRQMTLGHDGFRRPTMGDWLAMFADSEFVVTDSFHGCVFSIVFHKPFIAIANRERGLDRFLSLLGPLGLTDRLIDGATDLGPQTMQPIDWAEVDRRLDEQRAASLDFLRTALAKTPKKSESNRK